MAKLYGIGVGVGDPELLTVKAVRVLGETDILLLPRANTKTYSTAYEIVKDYLPKNIETIFVDFTTQDDDKIREKNRKEYASIVQRAIKEDKIISFITIGDPMTLSTFVYVMELLDSKIEVESIPGVTSFASICSRLKTPLLMGDETMKVIPISKNTNFMKELEGSDNLIFMKISRNLTPLKEALKKSDLLDKAVLVSNCGKNDEKIFYNLEEVNKDQISYFSTVLVKKSGLVQYQKT